MCPPKPGTVGCEKGVWALNRSGFAVIAVLDKPATYRICVNRGSKGPVLVAVDQAVISPQGHRPAIYPPPTAEQVFNSACALVTGKTIHVQAVDTLSNPQAASGDYQRMDAVNPLSNLHAFHLQMVAGPDKDNSALLASTQETRLHRVCIGPLTPPDSLAEGRRHIYTDKGFVFATNNALRGFPFSNSTCVDLDAKQVILFGPIPVPNDSASGFVAY
ncbi:hypothetical protein GCM10025759_32570 [Lysobacter panacisoli]|uniref:Uncharacterized protein n=2 Tax=Lysobacter panacisoli TaxID=1255263 RepID=A0ABP9LSG6_9GAMM